MNKLQPVFEAEVLVEGVENKTVFLKWNLRSKHCLKNADYIEMQLLFPQSDGGYATTLEKMSADLRAVVEYLHRNGFVKQDLHGQLFIEVDVSDHISVTESGNDIDLPLQYQLPLSRNFRIEHRSMFWSVVIRRVATSY